MYLNFNGRPERTGSREKLGVHNNVTEIVIGQRTTPHWAWLVAARYFHYNIFFTTEKWLKNKDIKRINRSRVQTRTIVQLLQCKSTMAHTCSPQLSTIWNFLQGIYIPFRVRLTPSFHPPPRLSNHQINVRKWLSCGQNHSWFRVLVGCLGVGWGGDKRVTSPSFHPPQMSVLTKLAAVS